MAGLGKSWTGTGKGSGRRWRGADGPGGGGWMFARVGGAGECGSGPLRGAPDPSSAERTFLALFYSCRVQPSGAGRRWGSERQRRAPLGSACRHRRGRHRLGADRRCGWAATCPFLYTSYSKRTNAPERLRAMRERRTYGNRRRDLAGAGAFTSPPLSATTFRNILAHMGFRRHYSMGWPWRMTTTCPAPWRCALRKAFGVKLDTLMRMQLSYDIAPRSDTVYSEWRRGALGNRGGQSHS